MGTHDAHGHHHADHAHHHEPREGTGASATAPSASPSPHAGGHELTATEAKQARRLKTVLSIVSAFFVLELSGALVAQSVVLQADALHLLMDVAALAASFTAMRLAVRRPTPRFTFGLRRAEPVAAIVSACLVLVTTAGIVFEGVEALGRRTAPRVDVMLAVAVVALFVNGLSAWLLHDSIGHGHGHDHGHDHAHDPDNPDDDDGHGHQGERKGQGHALNIRGAWLHLLGDALGALAAIAAALVIRFGGPTAADPIASFVVATILLGGSLRLLRDAALVLLEASPRHLSVGMVRDLLLGLPDVDRVHDLHVWTLGAGHDAVTAHVETRSTDPALGQRISASLRGKLGVEYVTVQVETGGAPCRGGPDAGEGAARG